jgi:predicted aminopeptidase
MKNFIIAVAIMMAVIPAVAQTATTPAQKQTPAKTPAATQTLASPEKRAVEYSNELRTKLHLTDDQYNKVLAVNAECIRRKDALRANGQKGGQGSKDIATYRKQQFQTILTPDQQAQLKALHAQNGQRKGAKDAKDTE